MKLTARVSYCSRSQYTWALCVPKTPSGDDFSFGRSKPFSHNAWFKKSQVRSIRSRFRGVGRGRLDRSAGLAAAGIARPMMANLAAIDEFGYFGGQQPVAAIGTCGRRQIALELHGRVMLGSSLTRRKG